MMKQPCKILINPRVSGPLLIISKMKLPWRICTQMKIYLPREDKHWLKWGISSLSNSVLKLCHMLNRLWRPVIFNQTRKRQSLNNASHNYLSLPTRWKMSLTTEKPMSLFKLWHIKTSHWPKLVGGLRLAANQEPTFKNSFPLNDEYCSCRMEAIEPFQKGLEMKFYVIIP